MPSTDGEKRAPRSSFLILKSMPIVVMKLDVKLSSENRSRRQDLPTPTPQARRVQKNTSRANDVTIASPLSPIRSSFIW